MRTTYENEEDFWSVMNPIFMLEVRSQLHQECTSNQRSPHKFKLKELAQKPNKLILKLKVDAGKKNSTKDFIHHDLVVMHQMETENKASEHRILGIIESSSKFFIRIKIFFQESSPRHQIFYDLFTLNSTFKVQKIGALSTMGRCFVALDNIRKFVLKSCLLDPKKYFEQQKVKKNKYLTISRELLNNLKKTFNAAQMKAIKASLKIEGITLIQGPPGTGKSKTILGILAALFGSEPKRDKQSLLSDKERIRILNLNQACVLFQSK